MKYLYVLLAIFTSILCSSKVNAQVLIHSVPSIAVEGNTILIKGDRFDSRGNALKVIAKNPNGTTVTLNTRVVNEDKFLVTMPAVGSDTKILLSISGGNIPVSNPQVFVTLVMDKPDNAPGESGTVEDDDFNNNVGGPDDDNTPPELANNIMDLPNLEFIGNANVRTVIRGDLQIQDDLTIVGDTTINGTLSAKNIEGTFTGPVVFKSDRLDLQTNGSEVFGDTTQRSLNVENKNLFHLSNAGSARLGALIGARAGQKVIIIFDTTIELVDNNTHSASSLDIEDGATVFNTDASLELIYDGQSWYQVSRANN